MSKPTELPDLDKMEATLRKATKDARHMIVIQPAAVLALIALARRAQPEGEAPQADIKEVRYLLTNALPALDREYRSLAHEVRQYLAKKPAAQQAAAPGALLEILRDVHDTLASESDSDIDHFEDDDEKREGAPVQYAARKVMEVMDMLKAAAPSAPGTPKAPVDKHLPGWERGIATVTLTGHQLREALDFVNPEGDDDVDQRDDWLTFGIVQHKDDASNATTGLCCWNDDSDGVLPLNDYPRAAQLDGSQGEGS